MRTESYQVNALLEYAAFQRLDDAERNLELIEKILGAREVQEPLEIDEEESTEVL